MFITATSIIAIAALTVSLVIATATTLEVVAAVNNKKTKYQAKVFRRTADKLYVRREIPAS